jgi:hypothetical protein
MPFIAARTPGVPHPWRRLLILFLVAILGLILGVGQSAAPIAYAQKYSPAGFYSSSGMNPANPQVDEQIEQAWHPAYLNLATGDPHLFDHGIYAWPFDLDTIGWTMQSYQNYGSPYFHHGTDMMKMWGTEVYNRSGGQVINIENYNPGWDLYWEVAVLDPDGYIWQYHHIQRDTIPQAVLDKYQEYLADPINGGFIPADTHIGNIIEWPVWSFGKQFNHIHLNILAAGGVFVNSFEFHNPLPDTVSPEIQGVGLVQNGVIHPGNDVQGNYSLYVHARDLILDDVYYLPPWEINFSVDGGPQQTTWRFDNLPGGASDTAYLDDFYLVPPTCGDYECRDYYIDLGFIPDSQFVFPATGGEHSVLVTVSDYAGNSDSQTFTYTVIGPPNQKPVANPQTLSILEDTSLGILLTGSDPEGSPITFTVVSSPTHGVLAGIAPDLFYTPALNYNGGDSFKFKVNDGIDDSPLASIHINVTPVNDAPVADSQSVTTLQSIPVMITLAGFDVDGDNLTYSIFTPPTYGTLSGSGQDLVYTPDAGYQGVDSFSFIANDGLVDSIPALVTININQHTIFVPVIFR